MLYNGICSDFIPYVSCACISLLTLLLSVYMCDVSTYFFGCFILLYAMISANNTNIIYNNINCNVLKKLSGKLFTSRGNQRVDCFAHMCCLHSICVMYLQVHFISLVDRFFIQCRNPLFMHPKPNQFQ